MKLSNLLLLLVLLGLASGCTAFELEGYTVNQALSLSGQRYQEVLDNLAVVAHNENTLPAFSLADSGSANVQDMVQFDPKTVWNLTGFFQQFLSVLGKHSPELSWTFDPVTDPIQLTALHYACQWAVRGGPEPGLPYEMLRGSRYDDVFPDPTHPNPYALWPHFDVAWRLERHPNLWVHHGCRKDVDSRACYTAKCCDTYVWVNPEDLSALTDFTLVVLDIATTLPASVTPKIPSATVVVSGPGGTCDGQCPSSGLPLGPPAANAIPPDPHEPKDPKPETGSAETQASFDPAPAPPSESAAPQHQPKSTPSPPLPGGMIVVTESWHIFRNDCAARPQYLVRSGNYIAHLPDPCAARSEKAQPAAAAAAAGTPLPETPLMQPPPQTTVPGFRR